MPGAERVLDFSLGQAHLALRLRQLLIRREGMPDVSVPMEDIAVVVLASRQSTCTLGALDGLMGAGAAVIVCDDSMLPSGLMLPLAGHFNQTKRMLAQATAKEPVRKRIWQQIVQAKVRAQGSLLASFRSQDAGLSSLAKSVRSGDPSNVESHAAQRYWPLLFGPDFRRRHDAPDQNRLLNYGYAVLRAAVGRALCSAGLHPSLGVHHHSRSDPYCLADDLMEPYRPVIDGEVAVIAGETGCDTPLDPATKARLVGTLHERLSHDGESRTIFDWISRSANSLAQCICGQERRVFFPRGLIEP